MMDETQKEIQSLGIPLESPWNTLESLGNIPWILLVFHNFFQLDQPAPFVAGLLSSQRFGVVQFHRFDVLFFFLIRESGIRHKSI